MKILKRMTILMLAVLLSSVAFADEGMWILKELSKQNLERMKELGFTPSYEKLYSETDPCIMNSVVIFGGGCSGVTVSDKGLIFTNHHCGFESIQKLSTVEHDYLKDGFVSQTFEEELPVPGLSVRYLRETKDVSDRINKQLEGIEDEERRMNMADSIGAAICKEVNDGKFISANVIPFYNNNKYYLIVYDVFHDVRLVFAPTSSMGKFGGDTDNWMWPRHTCDFSVFRVYANGKNQACNYDKRNKPYKPKYAVPVSMQGYKENDYAMTIGFPGSTDRFLSSWGVKQRMEDINVPRIEVRGIKQELWKKAMLASDDVRIKYSSKYARSANYWKNSIGMNKGLTKLKVVDRKKEEEALFSKWVAQDPAREKKYGEVLDLLEKGYKESNKCIRNSTYLMEAFLNGTEIIGMARTIEHLGVEGSEEDVAEIVDEAIMPFFKDYNATLDQQVLAAMMKIIKKRVDPEYLPDIYKSIDKKFKGDYDKYAAYVFKKTKVLRKDDIIYLMKDPKKKEKKLSKDPATLLANSVIKSFYKIEAKRKESENNIAKGKRLYVAGVLEKNKDVAYTSDANFTMRMSYGSIGGYRPYDAAMYKYYSTDKGILEKEDITSDEFFVQSDILDLIRKKDFGPYGNGDKTMNLCFLSNNDITGGNSGSPVFGKNGNLIGLAFDGNWEAMSGDIAFEPELQRTISVDIRFVLFIIDKWGKCPRLINELKLMK